jgi:excisionase family DNA binding protein
VVLSDGTPLAFSQSCGADGKKGKGGHSKQMKTDNSHVMTVKELSDYLKVHPSTVYRQLKRGQLPAFKVGSDWRFNVESIDRWRLEQDSFNDEGTR